MEKFQEATACRKCGLDDSGYPSLQHKAEWCAVLGAEGRIRRTCARCGWTWDELPLDADPANPGTGVTWEEEACNLAQEILAIAATSQKNRGWDLSWAAKEVDRVIQMARELVEPESEEGNDE